MPGEPSADNLEEVLDDLRRQAAEIRQVLSEGAIETAGKPAQVETAA